MINKFLAKIPFTLLCISFSCVNAGILDDVSKVFSGAQNILDDMNKAIEEIQTEAEWESLDYSSFKSVSLEDLKKLEEEGKSVPDKIKEYIKQRKAELITQNSVKLDKLKNSLTEYEKYAYIQNLPKISEWNSTLLNKLDTQLLRVIPNYLLLQTDDKDTLQKLKSMSSPLRTSENSEERRMKMENLFDNVILKLSEDIETWSSKDLEDFGIKNLMCEMIPMLKASLISNKINDFASDAANRDDCRCGHEIMKAIFADELNEDTNAAAVADFLKKYKSIEKYLMPEDVVFEVRDNLVIAEILDKNVKNCLIRSKSIAPKSRAIYRLDYDGTVTNEKLDKLGAEGVAVLQLASFNSSLALANQNQLNIMSDVIVGGDADAKRQAMMILYENKNRGSSINYQSQPKKTMRMARRLGSVSENDARNFLSDDQYLWSNYQLDVLLSKVRSSFNELGVIPKASLPFSKIRGLSTTEQKNLAESVPGPSLACLEAAEEIFGDKNIITASDLRSNEDILKCMPRLYARKITNDTSVYELMKPLKDSVISFALAQEFRDRILATMLNTNSVSDMTRTITAADISNVPVNVIATLGWSLRNLGIDVATLGTLKMLLVERLKSMKSRDEIPIKIQKVIVEEFIKGSNNKNGLIPGELDAIGDSYMMIPPYMIRNANKSTKQIFLKKLNNDIKERKLNILCITSDMVQAIDQAIKEVKGNPKNWTSLYGIDCLMWALNGYDGIEREVIDDGDCKLPEIPPSMHDIGAGKCLQEHNWYYNDVLNMEKNWKMTQRKALMTIMDKEIIIEDGFDDEVISLLVSPCEKATILGMDNMGNDEMAEVKEKELLDCMQYMGYPQVNRNNARRFVTDKLINEKNGVEKITELELSKQAHSFKGFNPDEIKKMQTSFFRPERDLLMSIGDIDFDQDQLDTIAEKVASAQSMSSITDQSLANMGNILGGLTETNFKAISHQRLENNLNLIKRLNGDKIKNARKGIIDSIYRNKNTWKAAEIKDLGPLVNEIEDFSTLNPEACSGLSPTVINLIDEMKMKELTPECFLNLPFETAIVLSSRSKILSSAQMSALNLVTFLGSSASIGQVLSVTLAASCILFAQIVRDLKLFYL